MESNSQASSRQHKPVSWKKGALIVAVLIIGLHLAYHAILFPWSLPLSGHSLVGDWYGELPAADGAKQWIALDLTSQTGKCFPNCRRLDVTAELCTAQNLHPYRGSGDTDNWRGTRFWLEISPTAYATGRPRSIRLRGEWERKKIFAEVIYGEEFAPGPRTSTLSENDAARRTGGPVIIPVELTRGSGREFRRTCQALHR